MALWEPFAAVEHLRQKLKAIPYTPVDDAELARLRRLDVEGVHNERIEGNEPDPGSQALFAMLREERVPVAICHSVVQRWLTMVLGPGDGSASGK